MVIDGILDRLERCGYPNKITWSNDTYDETDKQYILECAEQFGFNYIVDAFKSGFESLIKIALCMYILDNNYNKDLCNLIKCFDWKI